MKFSQSLILLLACGAANLGCSEDAAAPPLNATGGAGPTGGAGGSPAPAGGGGVTAAQGGSGMGGSTGGSPASGGSGGMAANGGAGGMAANGGAGGMAANGGAGGMAANGGAGGMAANGGAGGMAANGGAGGMAALDPQIPPADKAGMTAWIAELKAQNWDAEWSCEPEPTAKTEGDPGIHAHNDENNENRVCSNKLLAAAQPGSPAPKGAAAIKYVDEKVYVEVKVADDSAMGNGWYWHAPGASGLGLADCTDCHSAAGTDAAHPGFGDYVYFHVPAAGAQ